MSTTSTLPSEVNRCTECGQPGIYKVCFLLPDARNNPASNGYRGDDITHCSDRTETRCEEHKSDEPRGFHWASARLLAEPPTDRPFCCLLGCRNAAEYLVVTERRGGGMAGPDPYSDYTHACALHIGHLLGCQPDADSPDELYWHVMPVEWESTADSKDRTT